MTDEQNRASRLSAIAERYGRGTMKNPHDDVPYLLSELAAERARAEELAVCWGGGGARIVYRLGIP